MSSDRFSFLCAIGVSALTLAAGLTLPATPAQACGGLFCDTTNNTQVNQAAERIIFANRDDGTVTAVVQIQYQGEADAFSWLLPVPGIPTVEVSSDLAFQRLLASTNPTYVLNTQIEGECRRPGGGGGFAAADSSPDPSPEANFDDDGGVNVVASGAVGPYDFEVISVDPELEDAAEVATQWLDDNGYDVTAIGPDVLRPYLEDGMNLIGFRLQKNASAGSIRPVVLTYESENPMIPIRPTAVAANDDMGVMAFVLAPARAIPSNYRHLVINDAALNWFNPNTNYSDVINLAADEAGGHGFVTEFAGSSTQFRSTIFTSFDESAADELLQTDWSRREGPLVQYLANTFGTWDGFNETLLEAVPTPEGVRFEEFAACPGCFYDGVADIEGMDPARVLQAAEDNIIEPVRRTQALFEELPYMTRLFTTLSAQEMNVDPLFEFNADLPDHSNTHTATRIIECSPAIPMSETFWRVALPGGQTVRGEGNTWPVSLADMPANAQIEQLSTEGEGELVLDNTGTISQALEKSNARFTREDGCACTSVHHPGDNKPVWPALLLLGLITAVARRR